ncbi:MAG: ABC transporter ATP-binding protein [Candidatus Bathyarchaeota archaeon]|nr:ABC transporter ATP-binding protein [Candidatus Bathyarchaeota archaeon]
MSENKSKLAININGVSKNFGTVQAVKNLDLQIDAGTVFGFLGPNGSGKSTTMKMIMGLIKPNSGNLNVYGIDVTANPWDVKKIVGYVPESPRLYDFLTGLEYLDFIADVYGLDAHTKKTRIDEYLEAFDLENRENEMISGYSHGMQQKIAIIAALLHKPKLLILDEPLSGLDPKSARIVKDLIHKLTSEGVTTILSTHVLEIADAVCDKMAILYQGTKLAEGTPSQLRKESKMPDSTLEDIFLKLTGTNDIKDIVQALGK